MNLGDVTGIDRATRRRLEQAKEGICAERDAKRSLLVDSVPGKTDLLEELARKQTTIARANGFDVTSMKHFSSAVVAT